MIENIRLRSELERRGDIVCCKDCRRWHRALVKTPDGHQANWGMCELMKDDVDTDETDFCSFGERRKNNE